MTAGPIQRCASILKLRIQIQGFVYSLQAYEEEDTCMAYEEEDTGLCIQLADSRAPSRTLSCRRSHLPLPLPCSLARELGHSFLVCMMFKKKDAQPGIPQSTATSRLSAVNFIHVNLVQLTVAPSLYLVQLKAYLPPRLLSLPSFHLTSSGT